MNPYVLFVSKVNLLNMQVPAFQRVLPENYGVARNIWYDALRTQNDAASLGNYLIDSNVDMPLSLVIQLMDHTDKIMEFAPILGT
jgi:hypothetical protein